MIDRKTLIEGLQYCIEAKDKACPMACPFFKECVSGFKSSEPFYPIMRAALELLKEQPNVVRCKDCKRKDTLSCPKAPKRPDDWYCADGEEEDAEM